MEVSEELQGQLAQIRMVADALLAGLPLERNAEQEASSIIEQVLKWRRREEKVAWWKYFRLNDMPADEFIDEADGLGQLNSRIDWSRRSARHSN